MPAAFPWLSFTLKIHVNDSCLNKVSANHIAGSDIQHIEVACFLKLAADQVMFYVYDRRLRYSKIRKNQKNARLRF